MELAGVQEDGRGDVGMADENERRIGQRQRLHRDDLGQDVLPHRISRAPVEELRAIGRGRRLETFQKLPRFLAQLLSGPPGGRGRLRVELCECDLRRAERDEVVVPDEDEVGSVADERAALVRPRSVADGVPEAPDRVRRVTVDLGQNRLERVKVGVDIRDDGDAHGEILGYRGRSRPVAGGRPPALANRRPS